MNTGLIILEVPIFYKKLGKDYVDVLTTNIDKINKKLKVILGKDIGFNEKNFCQDFYTEYLMMGMILKVAKPEEEKKKKYPKLLIGDKELETFEESKYYWAKIDFPKSNKNNIYLIIVVFVILLFSMLPLLPLWIKHMIWWILFLSLCLILGFLILQLIVYIIFYLIGYDVWILPNLVFNKRFTESLSPIVGYYPRDDSKLEILFRICIVISFITLIYLSLTNPENVQIVWNMIKTFINDIEKWGYDKLTEIHV